MVLTDDDLSGVPLAAEEWLLDCSLNKLPFLVKSEGEVFGSGRYVIEDEDLIFCGYLGLLLEPLHLVDELSGVSLDLEFFVLGEVEKDAT